MYRPANTVPYATVESDLGGVYKKYSVLDHTVKIDTGAGSEAEQKCCTLQHWILQWTNGNLLLTRLEGELPLKNSATLSSHDFYRLDIKTE